MCVCLCVCMCVCVCVRVCVCERERETLVTVTVELLSTLLLYIQTNLSGWPENGPILLLAKREQSDPVMSAM